MPNTKITPKYVSDFCKISLSRVLKYAHSASVPERMLPMHIVLAYAWPRTLWNVCTCMAHTNETIAFASGSKYAGKKPTTSKNTISQNKMICRQWIFSYVLKQMCISSAAAVPIKNDTTGIRYFTTFGQSFWNSAVLKKTMLPVCALAKTSPRQK